MAQATHGSAPMRLVGLGLGDHNEFLTELYPHGKACVLEDPLAEEIGGLLRHALLGALQS
jgi:hypothetical protein